MDITLPVLFGWFAMVAGVGRLAEAQVLPVSVQLRSTAAVTLETAQAEALRIYNVMGSNLYGLTPQPASRPMSSRSW
jgi:hypothetical protein